MTWPGQQGSIWPETELSWSAILFGWPDQVLTMEDLRVLAEARIMTAEGEALIPLSELVGLQDRDDHRMVPELLVRLAGLEGRPVFFAKREWRIFQFGWFLDHLHEVKDADEPELNAYRQMQELESWWEAMGRPLDVPLLNPFIRSYAEAMDPQGGLSLTIKDLRAWMESQRQMMSVVTHLLAAGHREPVHEMARAIEAGLHNAQAHLQFAQDELSIYLRSTEGGNSRCVEINQYNAGALQARRQRSAGQTDFSENQ